MSAELTNKINFLNVRVDFGVNFKGKPLFGKNKTWRGIFFASLFGILTFIIQRVINVNSIINYSNYTLLESILFGFLFGFGAILADLIKSFFKRRIGIKPGRPWFPFDQIDLVLGSYILILPLYVLSGINLIILLVMVFILHIIINFIAYHMKIKKDMF